MTAVAACAPDLCIKIEEVQNPPPNPPPDTICVKPEAINHWLELAQAIYYAHHWKGPAKNPAISTLIFLTQTRQIKEALETSAAGKPKGICATVTPPQQTPPHPPTDTHKWNPWKITKFALDLTK